MDHVVYLANKFWRLAGTPKPVQTLTVLERMKFRIGSLKAEPAAIIIKPWDDKTVATMNPPAAAIQVFSNPSRIDCRYAKQATAEDNRYIEAFLAGYALLAMAEGETKVSFADLPRAGQGFEEVHRFARNLLVPSEALARDLAPDSGDQTVEAIAETFQVSLCTLSDRLKDMKSAASLH
jgi:hypothetical protein